jgi:hypothetical protein
MNESLELELIDESALLSVYENGSAEALIQRVTKEVEQMVFDVSTNKGRKECAAFAYKIAQAKTFADNKGKELKEESKKFCDRIDVERKKIRDSFDALKEKAREPLTKWEQRQERIVQDIKKIQQTIDEVKLRQLTSEQAMTVLEFVSTIKTTEENFDDNAEIAQSVKDKTIDDLKEYIAIKRKQEADAIELEQLRKQAKELEEKQRKDAEDADAKRIAEQNEIDRLSREKRIADESASKAKQEAELAEKKRIEEIERRRRQEDLEREISARKQIEEAQRLQRESEARENARIVAEKRAAEEIDRKKKDEAHKDVVIREIAQSIIQLESIGISKADSIQIALAISNGQIKHVSINW